MRDGGVPCMTLSQSSDEHYSGSSQSGLAWKLPWPLTARHSLRKLSTVFSTSNLPMHDMPRKNQRLQIPEPCSQFARLAGKRHCRYGEPELPR